MIRHPDSGFLFFSEFRFTQIYTRFTRFMDNDIMIIRLLDYDIRLSHYQIYANSHSRIIPAKCINSDSLYTIVPYNELMSNNNETNQNLDKLLAKASSISVDNFEVQDTDKLILDLFKKVYSEYHDVWVLRTQVKNKLKQFSNIDVKLEKLVVKGLLETKLFGDRKVYRLRVANI